MKRGNLDTETDMCREKFIIKTQGGCHLLAMQFFRLPEARREAWDRFSFTALSRNRPADTLILDF